LLVRSASSALSQFARAGLRMRHEAVRGTGSLGVYEPSVRASSWRERATMLLKSLVRVGRSSMTEPVPAGTHCQAARKACLTGGLPLRPLAAVAERAGGRCILSVGPADDRVLRQKHPGGLLGWPGRCRSASFVLTLATRAPVLSCLISGVLELALRRHSTDGCVCTTSHRLPAGGCPGQMGVPLGRTRR
jgi:hypothetical protein